MLITAKEVDKIEKVAEDELLEDEMIESEIIIDSSPNDTDDNSVANQDILTDNCFVLEFEINDRNTDCFQSFDRSFDCSSGISSNYSKSETASIKSETASIKSDTGSSGHESDTKVDKLEVNSRPIFNGVFKDVNISLIKSKTEDNRSNSSNNYNCKWTHCDWPGAYDDLVDHIREIHVELQPYQQQKHNWNEFMKNKNINKISNNKSIIDRKDTNLLVVNNSKKCESTQQYVCLWEGCKVYGKGSLSRNWLERHVLEQHSGPRPFKCIVERCGARFKVQSALERHVNSHFKPSVDFSNSNSSIDVTNSSATPIMPSNCSISDNNSCVNSMQGLSPFELHLQQTSRATMSTVGCKSMDSNGFCGPNYSSNGTPNKILKRKKSATKLRRKCYTIVKCSEDFFDECVMEQVRYGLIQMNAQTGLDINGNQSTITFHSKVIARRENDSGEVNVLLKWEPNNILPDVWVSEEEATELRSKTIPVSTLPPDCLAQLIETNGFERKPKIKQRRK